MHITNFCKLNAIRENFPREISICALFGVNDTCELMSLFTYFRQKDLAPRLLLLDHCERQCLHWQLIIRGRPFHEYTFEFFKDTCYVIANFPNGYPIMCVCAWVCGSNPLW